MLEYLGLLLLFAGSSQQQKDPLNDFCRRFGHQSAVVDQKLYIDGGLVNWNPISQNPRNFSNTWLLWNDLETSPTGVGVPQMHANLSKNASIPAVSGGSLWPDEVNKRVYLYGGEYREATPNSPELLSYDIINDQWDSSGPPGNSIGSVSWGGNVGVSELGRGYVLGGWLSNNSMPGWTGGPLATSYLLQYDMVSGGWTNSTGPDNASKAEGVMVYLPASDNGLLVYFGGGTAPYNNETLIASPMSTIYVYDIKSSQWYTQKAGGNVPFPRKRFCAGATWAPDRSSYNIYLYGGLGFDTNATGFDDVYILSLPTFTWIKWWQGSGVGKPHHSLTCNVVHGGQMLIMGGTFPLSDACDSPATWGIHNLDMGKQSGKMWVEYQLNITSYVVPSEIVSAVGGSSLGGATATAPTGGFDNADLSVYFVQKAAIASRTPTRAIPTPSVAVTSASTIPASKKLGTGAIAGIAVGGVVVLVALIAGAWFLIRRHRKNRVTPQTPPSYNSNSHYSQGTNQTSQTQYQSPGPHHQLPADPITAELSGSELQMHHVDPKGVLYPHVHEYDNQHLIYNSPPPFHDSPTISPQPSTYSTGTQSPHGSHTSPVPTFSTIARPPRKPVSYNQTYYSS